LFYDIYHGTSKHFDEESQGWNLVVALYVCLINIFLQGIVIHEFMHILSVSHEMQRPDRNIFFQVLQWRMHSRLHTSQVWIQLAQWVTTREGLAIKIYIFRGRMSGYRTFLVYFFSSNSPGWLKQKLHIKLFLYLGLIVQS